MITVKMLGHQLTQSVPEQLLKWRPAKLLGLNIKSRRSPERRLLSQISIASQYFLPGFPAQDFIDETSPERLMSSPYHLSVNIWVSLDLHSFFSFAASEYIAEASQK